MVATLGIDGTNTYSLDNERSYDAWGEIRQGATTSGPTNRYCANLGEQQDDESGLIYSRARYYEPSTGRFISDDPARHGNNWAIHCCNDPVNKIDPSGKEEYQPSAALTAYLLTMACWIGSLLASQLIDPIIANQLFMLINGIASGLPLFTKGIPAYIQSLVGSEVKALESMPSRAEEYSMAYGAICEMAAEVGMLTAELLAEDAEGFAAEQSVASEGWGPFF